VHRRRFLSTIGSAGIASWLWPRTASAFAANAREASGSQAAPASSSPIAIHPQNARYFLFRGRPLVLLAASEHYGSIVNRRFDFERYLHDAAARKQTVTRTFLLYRELQSVRNPYSPLKPESPDYVTPYPRTGPGTAHDGELKYDLDQWNSEYLDRLHGFLSLASQLGIVVELTVFSNTYEDEIWGLNPLRFGNNLQGVGNVKWQEYLSQREAKLFERQIAFARKVVQETSRYDNVYYEVCNEPGGGFAAMPSPAEVDAWQAAIATTLREEMKKLNRHHLLSGQYAFTYEPDFFQGFDSAYSGQMLDIVNIHPLPHLDLKGRKYELGNFMSKELQLREFRDFFVAACKEAKPTVSDEDNAASIYLDDAGWTIERKRAWMAVMCGSHYDFIDFSIQAHLEAGTDESQKKIRNWIRNLSQFIASYDFIPASNSQEWILGAPDLTVAAGLAVEGKDYVAYIADSREVSDAQAGKPIQGKFSVRLPAGDYQLRFYSPVSGQYVHSQNIRGDAAKIPLGPFEHDVALRITRSS